MLTHKMNMGVRTYLYFICFITAGVGPKIYPRFVNRRPQFCDRINAIVDDTSEDQLRILVASGGFHMDSPSVLSDFESPYVGMESQQYRVTVAVSAERKAVFARSLWIGNTSASSLKSPNLCGTRVAS